jgi:hypothetical protein
VEYNTASAVIGRMVTIAVALPSTAPAPRDDRAGRLPTRTDRMSGWWSHRALVERIVAMEVDGRVAAAVFLCPDGSGLYPAYAGLDQDLQAVVVLVDLKLLPLAIPPRRRA